MTERACIFCAIVADPSTAHVVADEPLAMAFLDRSPVFHGHTLVIPKTHFETLVDLPPELFDPVFGMAQRVSRAVESGLGAAGSFVAMNNKVSQSVPHLHVHVVPRNRKDGLRGFFWPRVRYRDDDQMAEVAAVLRSAL
jgi:histidine triad (HIT) family protein